MDALPILRTVLLAAAAILQNWQSLLVALVIPAACILVVETAAAELLPNGFLFALAAWALGAPFYALFAVVVHRTVILGSDSLPNRFGMFWSDRETRFIGWTIALFLVTLVLAFIIGVVATALALANRPGPVPILFGFVVWFGFGYIYTRLSMLFPATAVDEETSIGRVWQLTDGNGLRMIAVMLLTVGPLFAAAFGITYVLPGGLFAQTVDVLLGFIAMMVGVCAVSVTYRQLIRIEREQSGDPPSDAPADPVSS